MNWLEVSLVVDGEAAEAAADLLQGYVQQGVVIEAVVPDRDAWPEEALAQQVAGPLVVRAYLPIDSHTEAVRARIDEGLWQLGRLYPMPQPQYRLVAEEDWADAWKEHYHPIRVGRHIVICPRWRQVTPQPGDVVILMDPGMAFGTGTHPSTQLCLAALEDHVCPGARVLDLGCGSGILGIAAVKLGAASVLALDIDPVAVRTTQENALHNGVARHVAAQHGSLKDVVEAAGRYELVLVNILAKVIIAFCEEGLGSVVAPGGTLIAAGVIADQAEAVRAAFDVAGLCVVETRRAEDWVAFVCQRPGGLAAQ